MPIPLPSTPAPVIVEQSFTNNWYTGASIPALIDYPFAFAWAYVGLNGSTWTQFVWTAKKSESDADSAAILTIKVTNPSAMGDGLTILNGAPASTAADGALTVSTANAYGQTATTITLAINSEGMALTFPASLFWELTPYLNGVKQLPLDGGQFIVNPSVRAAAGAA